jgi:hypothetical protein
MGYSNNEMYIIRYDRFLNSIGSLSEVVYDRDKPRAQGSLDPRPYPSRKPT